MLRRPPRSTRTDPLFPYTTLFRSNSIERAAGCTLALRLGLRQIDGFSEAWAVNIANAREHGPFRNIETLARQANLPHRALKLLADADTCRSIEFDRRPAIWEVRRTPDHVLPLFAAARARELGKEPDNDLPVTPLHESVINDYP